MKLRNIMGKIMLAIGFALVLSICGVPEKWDSYMETVYAETSGEWEYSITNSETKTATITKYVGSEADVTIPTELDGYTITAMGNYAFSGCNSLERIVIPEKVTQIGSGAFNLCSNLTEVEIKGELTSIENAAFFYCESLAEITIPATVTRINSSAFYGCSSLKSITIPQGVTEIGSHVFRGCSSLTSIVVEEGNTVYDSRNNCNAIIEKATNKLLYGCSNTKIPVTVTSICDWAFADCKDLDKINIPEGVTTIGKCAFSGCISLTTISIPSTVTSIGDPPFLYCYGLNSIVVEEENTVYDSRNNCNAIIEKATNKLLYGCGNTVIP